jgi:phosphotransferase system IIA component
MFICPSKNCIVAPYDGGVDIIVDSSKKEMN